VELSRIIASIDSEIARLQQARALLAERSVVSVGRGRPSGRRTAAKAPKQRRLSAVGRKRISDAMKKRWAEKRKQAARA
jgi:hypothetical protein